MIFKPKNLEMYLARNLHVGDFTLRSSLVTIDGEELTAFYIHPSNVSGETADFVVRENEVFDNPLVIKMDTPSEMKVYVYRNRKDGVLAMESQPSAPSSFWEFIGIIKGKLEKIEKESGE